MIDDIDEVGRLLESAIDYAGSSIDRLGKQDVGPRVGFAIAVGLAYIGAQLNEIRAIMVGVDDNIEGLLQNGFELKRAANRSATAAEHSTVTLSQLLAHYQYLTQPTEEAID